MASLTVQLAFSSILLFCQAFEADGLADGRSSHAMDVIQARGFIAEQHSLKTRGSTLTLNRIINPLADPKTLNKYPVLYGHGVLYSSMSMISRSEHSKPRKPVLGQPTINYGNTGDGSDDYSLPFMYSNNNFDVWMFDARGTDDDNRNESALADFATANKFWDFSLDDQALVDVPKLIDFVLFKTASQKVVYTGFSESTLFMFALQSAAPEYQNKVAAFVALAPVAFAGHVRGFTLPVLSTLAAMVPENIHYSLLPQPVFDYLNLILRNMCVQGLSQMICGRISDSIGGKGSGQHAPEFYSNFFKATSIKAIKQFLQLYLSKRFAMYDYGVGENIRRYGQPVSPNYDLRRIKNDRIILARGLMDMLATPEDQSRLIMELGTRPFLDIVIPKYNHFDFVDGKDLIRLVNGPAMVAVYQCMYKDGPNILRDDVQNALIDARKAIPFGEAPASGNPASNMASKTVRGAGALGLFKIPVDMINKLTGGQGIFNEFRILSASG